MENYTENEQDMIIANEVAKENSIIVPNTPTVSRGDKVLTILDKQGKKALDLLGGDIKRLDRIKTGFMLSLIKNQLESCDLASIANAFYTCCEYDLDPSSGFGKVYLIKYHNREKSVDEVNTQIGYLGWMDLIMRRTDLVSYVDAQIVYEDDVFEVERSDQTRFRHVPNLSPTAERKLKLAYAVVKFKTGDIRIEIATLQDINEAMERSKSAKFSSSPWKTNFSSMAKIVPLRKFKQLALSMVHSSSDIDDIDDDYTGYNMRGVKSENNKEEAA